MGPVDRAGSVSEISPRQSFCSYENPGWPGCGDLGFSGRDLDYRAGNLFFVGRWTFLNLGHRDEISNMNTRQNPSRLPG